MTDHQPHPVDMFRIYSVATFNDLGNDSTTRAEIGLGDLPRATVTKEMMTPKAMHTKPRGRLGIGIGVCLWIGSATMAHNLKRHCIGAQLAAQMKEARSKF